MHPSLTHFTRTTLAILVALSVGACANSKKKPRYAGAEDDGDFVNGSSVALSERQDGVSFLGSNVNRERFQPIYFAFDSYAVEPNEAHKLRAVAEFLRSGSSELIIAGFTDERGTAEYNRGLGERRALAVRSYLIGQGADASRIQTTSFGAEMPADPGYGEAAWAKNRRTEFGVVE